MSLADEELSAMIRQHATRHAAPDSLRAAIRTQTALAEAGRTSARPAAGLTSRGLRELVFGLRRGAIPISFALGMLCMALLLPLLPPWELGGPLEADLVADHVRALRVGPIAEVISTDRHTVKPWFQGRLDFAPPVFDLANAGYTLVGGRIEHVRGNAVATLAYTRNKHLVDVFIWPNGDHHAPVRSLRRGFNVVHWADGSMQYWAVSDMDAGEIENFALQWRERAAAH
jgi:anti-sigma factor RsiW